jgi:hypothetical protein
MKIYEAVLMAISTLLGGGMLGYFLLPKKVRVRIDEKIRDELRAEVAQLRQMVIEANKTLIEQAYEIGHLRAEVAQCKELHAQLKK